MYCRNCLSPVTILFHQQWLFKKFSILVLTIVPDNKITSRYFMRGKHIKPCAGIINCVLNPVEPYHPQSNANSAFTSTLRKELCHAADHWSKGICRQLWNAKSRGGVIEENEVLAEKMVAHWTILLACPKYFPFFAPVSHLSSLRLPGQRCKSLHLLLHHF